MLAEIKASVPDKKGTFSQPPRQTGKEQKSDDEVDWQAELLALDPSMPGAGEVIADNAVIRALRKAARRVLEGTRLDPGGASANDALAAHHFTLGKALEAQGKDGGPDFRRAIALKPDYAPAKTAAKEVATAAVGRPCWMLYVAGGIAALPMLLFAAVTIRRRA